MTNNTIVWYTTNMADKNELIKQKRRNAAIWYMYVEVGFSLEEIAQIFKITKGYVHEIVNKVAKERNDELQKYSDKL